MSARRFARRSVVFVLAAALAVLALAGCGSKTSGAAVPAVGSRAAGGTSTATAPAKAGGSASVTLKLPNIAPASTLEPTSYDGFEQLPSFTYHTVDPTLKSDIAITPAKFESELQTLSRLGYHSITARQLIAHQTHGAPLPSKPVMITFDDGWRNQYVYAWPLLRKYGFTATFFINPQPISASYKAYLTRDMVVALAKAGNDIESHTWRHLRLTRDSNQTAEQFQKGNISELTRATSWIWKVTGTKPEALCYPYGYYDLEAIGMAQAAGYKAGFTVDEGVADARPWDAWQMKRFTIANVETPASFKRRLLSGPLPVTDIQPPPGSRIVGVNGTISADISAIPSSVTDVQLSGGPGVKRMQIVTRGGKKYAQATLHGGKSGFRVISMRGTGPDGRAYYASWDIEIGDK